MKSQDQKPASWVIVRRSSGTPMAETFKQSTAERFSTMPQFEVLTITEWLVRFNRSIA